MKKAIKKSTKEPIKKVAAKSEEVYDEYGVCIACKGGKEGCLHQNLFQEAGITKCVTCGCCV